MVNACVRICVHIFIRVLDSLFYLECDFLTKASLMTPMD